MKFIYERTIDPASFTCTLKLDAEDIENAFAAQADPDENLYYDFEGPGFPPMPLQEQLRVLARVVELAQSATQLAGTLSDPVPK